jgi:hypothetical protein
MLVKTPNGWSKFSGVKKKEVDEIFVIKTRLNKTLSCSTNHPILTVDGFINADKLKLGDTLETVDGFDVITNIELIKKKTLVYDLLNVEDGHSYITNGFVSHNCVGFLGSSDNLIAGHTMKILKEDVKQNRPIHYNPGYGYKVFREPEKNRKYTMTCDVSRGKGLDYSTFQVIDITELPYKQVAVFKNNLITPTDFAAFVYNTAKAYNEAYVMVEVNDIGGQVADILFFDYGYEYLISTESAGSRGKRVSGGFGGKNIDRGLRTTVTTKALGCSMLKLLVEQRKLLIFDNDTVNEFASFEKKGNSYEASSGKHDDLVMALVLFSWLTTDSFFKNLNDMDIMHSLRDLSDEQIYQELVPFGIVSSVDYDFDDVTPVKREVIGGEVWDLVDDNSQDSWSMF